MANHGYIKTNQELNINDLLLNINNILNKNFNCINANIENDCIIIHIDFIDYLNMRLWISDECDERFLIKQNSVIEIRHGFGCIFRDWLEYWLTNELGLLYNSYIIDDGFDDIITPKKITTDLMKYIKSSRHKNALYKWQKNMNNLSKTKTDQEIIDIFINNKKLFDRVNKLKTI